MRSPCVLPARSAVPALFDATGIAAYTYGHKAGLNITWLIFAPINAFDLFR